MSSTGSTLEQRGHGFGARGAGIDTRTRVTRAFASVLCPPTHLVADIVCVAANGRLRRASAGFTTPFVCVFVLECELAGTLVALRMCQFISYVDLSWLPAASLRRSGSTVRGQAIGSNLFTFALSSSLEASTAGAGAASANGNLDCITSEASPPERDGGAIRAYRQSCLRRLGRPVGVSKIPARADYRRAGWA